MPGLPSVVLASSVDSRMVGISAFVSLAVVRISTVNWRVRPANRVSIPCLTLGRHNSDVQETIMPAREIDKTSKPAVRKAAKRTAAPGKGATTLKEAMTGRASPAKAAVGDKPVFAYIASLP